VIPEKQRSGTPLGAAPRRRTSLIASEGAETRTPALFTSPTGCRTRARGTVRGQRGPATAATHAHSTTPTRLGLPRPVRILLGYAALGIAAARAGAVKPRFLTR
jgi:hypothetical protein